jgi:hypothetical protein
VFISFSLDLSIQCVDRYLIYLLFLTKQDGGISMHLHGVPSQILCRVINVELKVSGLSHLFFLHLLPLIFSDKQALLWSFMQSENDFIHACLILLPELDVSVIHSICFPVFLTIALNS